MHCMQARGNVTITNMNMVPEDYETSCTKSNQEDAKSNWASGSDALGLQKAGGIKVGKQDSEVNVHSDFDTKPSSLEVHVHPMRYVYCGAFHLPRGLCCLHFDMKR